MTLQGTDPREAGRAAQSSAQSLGRAQAAGQRVDSGIRDLRRLENIAAESAAAPAGADRTVLNDEAQQIGARLAEADQDPNVQGVRQDIRQSTLERNANQARSEASRLGRAAEQARQNEDRRPPTLVLEPRRGNADQIQRDADQAARNARGAEDAVLENRRQSAEPLPQPPPRDETTLRPEKVDVSTPEEARTTQRAVGEAQTRATRFRQDIATQENAASREAETATRQAGSGTRRIATEVEGRQTAERIQRVARQDPRRFVEAQANVAAEQAAALLA